MPDYGTSDTDQQILTKLDMILSIVIDLQQRQRSMEERQKVIKKDIDEIDEEVQPRGSFASSDFGAPPKKEK